MGRTRTGKVNIETSQVAEVVGESTRHLMESQLCALISQSVDRAMQELSTASYLNVVDDYMNKQYIEGQLYHERIDVLE